MTTLQLRERTEQMLHQAVPGAQNLDEKVLLLLEAEYLHKLSRYRRANQRFERKYGMSFDEFVAQRVVRQQGYSWEVENDAMDWESAIGGIITMERLYLNCAYSFLSRSE